MRAALCSVLLIASVLPLAPAAAAQEPGQQPYELVRELQKYQDDAALKGTRARKEQSERIARVATQLTQFGPQAWSDPRNVRAAVIYVLSGGDPRILRNLTASGKELGIDERLVKGALAYSERRDAEAAEQFETIDVEALDRTVGGHVALVRALLIIKDDQAKAANLLDRARVISPGTIVEESALRRETILVAKMGQLDRFDALSAQYLRRFGSSIFVGTFARQFAQEIVAHKYADDEKRLAKLDAALRELPDVPRIEASLAIAEEAIAIANVELVRFAGRIAAIDPKQYPQEATRMRLFEAAALIVTDNFDEASRALWSIDRSKLSAHEEALLDAALDVAKDISRAPSLSQAAAATETADKPAEAGYTPPVVSSAQQAIARVDQLLNEGAQ